MSLNIDYDGFLADMRTFYAIISEASRRLSSELKARHPATPWQKIAGAENIYRHDYEDVLHRLVWATVHELLPALGVVIVAELGPACQ